MCVFYTRLPGQDTTVSVTLFFCSLSMGMRDELFIPTVVAPFTATISSPHLDGTERQINVGVWPARVSDDRIGESDYVTRESN